MADKPFPNLLFMSFSLLSCFHLCNSCKPVERGRAEVNGLFVFGASLVDNGNNNFLPNFMAKVNYTPYGIDFPLGPTGRFTNGRTIVDLLGLLLKLPSFIPPFADPMTRGTSIVHGVNYASGGSGILDETGSVTGAVINLNQQIRNFELVTLADLAAELGCKNIRSLSSCGILSNYLFVLATGGNDYSLNYFLRPASNNTSLEAFTHNLIVKLSQQIQRLYYLGGRKFVLVSISPLGCSPVVKPNEGCNEDRNRAALLFNAQLKSLVDQIKPRMPGSNLVYVDIYKTIIGIINDPISRGFNNTTTACCEVTSNGILCNRNGRTCANRSSYVFFDGQHNTEAVNSIIAMKAYSSNLTTEVYPINVQQLAKL